MPVSLILFATLVAAEPAPPLADAVRQAIADEIGHGLTATKRKDIDQYMDGVPADYRIVEDDGSITDRDTLRAKQLQAWSIIRRTNALEQHITSFELGCDGGCATVGTDQRWDRQMLGRDGIGEHNVVTTQRHIEGWELRGSRWVNVSIKELGGTVTVDGKPYA